MHAVLIVFLDNGSLVSHHSRWSRERRALKRTRRYKPKRFTPHTLGMSSASECPRYGT